MSANDLIRRSVIKERMIARGWKHPDSTVTEFVEDDLPAVDVKPVVKGEWLCEGTKCRIGYNDYEYWNKWRCSCCGYIRTEGWEHTSEGQEPKNSLICENCGADMRKKVKDD